MSSSYPTNERPPEDLTARARIRDAAMAEFADKGYTGATMRSIAAAAGVSVGLVQHHFGTKDGLRAACDEAVVDLVRFKTVAVEEGNIGDPRVLGSLMSMAPAVQRYVGRALVDSSTRISGMLDELMASGEAFLVATWPDRFDPDTSRTRDAAAVLIALNTSTMVLQDHVARRMGVEPWTPSGIQHIGMATLDAFEAVAAMVASDMWQELRAAVDAYRADEQE